MRRNVILFFIIICLALVSCGSNEGTAKKEKYGAKINNDEAVTEKDNTEFKEKDFINAYKYIKNCSVWDSVLVFTKRYDEVVGKKIHNDETLQVYRENDVVSETETNVYFDRDAASNTKEKVHRYYFIGKEKSESELFENLMVDHCVALEYYVEKETWKNGFSEKNKDYVEDLYSKGNVEYIGEINMVYPNVFFPKLELTDYKQKVLSEIRNYIKWYTKEYLKEGILERGIYNIMVRDFSNSDNATDFLIQIGNCETNA